MSGDNKNSMVKLAHDFLYHRIVSCEYMPGQELNEKQLLSETGFGRTPLREALLLLQKEGLIKIYARKGMIITPFDRKHINDLYIYRKLIEATIASQYCSFYSKSEMQKWSEQISNSSKLDKLEHFQLDHDFHMFIISIINNDILNYQYHSIMSQQIRLGMYAAIKNPMPGKDQEQHQAIIDALMLENPSKIRDAIIYHLNYSLIRSLESIN